MDTECCKEIEELHQFFEDWFRAAIGQTEAAYRRLGDVLEPSFELISPGGVAAPRSLLMESLWQAWGSRRSQEPPFRIWIEQFRGRSLGEGLHLVTYQEWQEAEAGPRGRLSTAVFRRLPETPNGVAWLHVHEVWLPSA